MTTTFDLYDCTNAELAAHALDVYQTDEGFGYLIRANAKRLQREIEAGLPSDDTAAQVRDLLEQWGW